MKQMKIFSVDKGMADAVAPLVAGFRVVLNSFKGIESKPDIESGREEIEDFLKAGYPIFAAADGERLAGYIVLRTEGFCIWVEQLYVLDEYRRKGIGSMLFGKAEEIAEAKGEDTLFNYVHPNNERIISFLRSKGYTVLNLIEIRKPYRDEKLTTTVNVGSNVFDY